MQDEPEGEECFQHKMSLKMNRPGQVRLRVNASHHAACRTSHLRPDAGVSLRQQLAQLRWSRPPPDLRLIERVLRTQKYLGLTKKDKGIVRRYLVKISGLSKAQITRLIARWRDCGVIQQRVSRRHRFPIRYRTGDIQLLAKVDGAHEGLSAPAVRRILQREFEVHGLAPYERLAAISASHIYNLRRSRTYREQRLHHTKTRASTVNIGERRTPDPRGQPGHLRVDTVHQGDTPKGKGLYHINAVDTVTQWEIVGCRAAVFSGVSPRECIERIDDTPATRCEREPLLQVTTAAVAPGGRREERGVPG